MPHVITQSCCNDASCVFACPVNCIHPTPDEPGFATSEMLYIDPVACVDCGACVTACPVSAIAPNTRLDFEQLPFVEINASYYPKRPAGVKLAPTSKLAPVTPAAEVRVRRQPLTVAVVGSGPAAMYAADELLVQQGVQVNVFEKLPTPYGLVRSGVAPDHQNTKRVTRLFDRIAGHRRFRFYLNVEIGKHLGHAELLAHHHAVLYAVGAPDDRRLTIDGMGLPGTGTATELVAWLNGHPDFNDLPVDLSHERVVIIDPGTGEPVPGAYVAGWIKRGPTGFIGTNKSCSMQTVQALVADFNDGRLTDPVATPTALDQLVQARQPQAIGCAGWRAIDAAEIARGSADGRVRNKFTDVAEMLAAATSAPKEPLRRRVLARLRDLGQPIVLTVPL